MTANVDLNANYYVDIKPKLMKDYDKMLKSARQVLRGHFSEQKIDQLLDESRCEYADLMPQLPYIGGRKNSGTTNLVGAAGLLALIRVLESEGLEQRAIGKVVYDTMERFFESRPRFVRWCMGKVMMSKPFKTRMEKQATAPHYPGGWRKVIVEDENFDFGQDVTECGIVTLFEQHGKEQYVPYMCLADFPLFRSVGIGLTRTLTIGNGAPVCDFRFKKGGTTPRGWPPESLEEFKQ